MDQYEENYIGNQVSNCPMVTFKQNNHLNKCQSCITDINSQKINVYCSINSIFLDYDRNEWEFE